MSQQAKTELSNEESNRGVCWYPLRKWWQSSRLFNQDLGLPPFLEPGDPRWRDVDRLQRSLAACSWPGYIPPPLFVPYISASMHHSGQKISEEQYKWRVNLEVAHFFPSDIFVSVSDGFLEVRGKHEERPDEHGFIARCFTRKYRLPEDLDATKIVSTLSADGILTVVAPVSENSIPAAIIIKVELEATGEEQEKEEAPDTDPGSCRAPEAPCLPSAEDDGEESPLEVHGDQAHTGSNTAGLEERRDQEEETLEKPAGESHPSAPVDGEGTENFQVSSEHNEAQEILGIPDTEHQEPAVDGEIQPGSGETTDEITHPEEQEIGKSPPNDAPSQELEVPDIKQEN
ncbi:hypothetical protein NQZ68_032628 [Dissostichus eleginoides]|uniref:Heat shock protein beta-1 n=1 Tax=Dissostichus eleginoides TaxID=100907 RepID=A0AAD9F8D9_DISEL|nr:hypothetical protein NQZ68_032628 [Dissostichus eleginoides]KAK1892549.1 Heat shock protein beta-1 [Dissostichus eleginoides]